MSELRRWRFWCDGCPAEAAHEFSDRDEERVTAVRWLAAHKHHGYGGFVTPKALESGSVEQRDSYHRWLYGDVPCLCESSYESLGVLYGVDCGKGWVRVTTEPDCPHHGDGAA